MKHFVKFLFVLILGITVYFISGIVDITWQQYQDTKDWESISIDGQLKDVPPFLAKNYINLQDKDAVETWQRVNQILTDLATQGQIKPEQLEEYRQALDKSVKMQEARGITSGSVDAQNKQLALYLEVEDTLKTVYSEPDTEKLKNLTGKLYSSNIDNSSSMQVAYLQKLKRVAKDYKKAKTFMSETLPTLGTLSDGVLMGSTQMDEDSTNEFVTNVKKKKLDKFPFINDLLIRLQGDEWIKVLTHNQMLADYETWQEAKKKLHSIDSSDYVLVDSIKTYQDALDAKLEVDVTKRDGYIIDKSSEVTLIMYDGKPVTKGKYIRKGCDAIVSIDAKYKKKKEKTEEDIPVSTENASTETVPSTEATTEISTDVPADTSTEEEPISNDEKDAPPVISTEAENIN